MNKEDKEAEIRNRLTLPMTVLNQFLEGKELPKQDIRLAIEELERLLYLIEKEVSDG